MLRRMRKLTAKSCASQRILIHAMQALRRLAFKLVNAAQVHWLGFARIDRGGSRPMGNLPYIRVRRESDIPAAQSVFHGSGHKHELVESRCAPKLRAND
jgi:hypothetical protein